MSSGYDTPYLAHIQVTRFLDTVTTLWSPNQGTSGNLYTTAFGYQSNTLSYLPLQLDSTGALKTTGSGGGGGNAAAGLTGAAVPTSADYTGYNSGGNLVGVSTANPLPVAQQGTVTVSGTVAVSSVSGTVTVAGTVTANIGTTNGLALDTSVNGLLVTPGTAYTSQPGPLAQGQVNTSNPAYTTGQTNVLSLNTSGQLRVAATQSGPSTVANSWWTKIADGVNGPAAVKPASTAAVAADPALVVAISPNNSVAVTGTVAVTLPADLTPASINITAQDVASTSTAGFGGQLVVTGAPTAGSFAQFTAGGVDTIQLQVTNVWTGSLIVEGSTDNGTTWVVLRFDAVLPNYAFVAQAPITANAVVTANVAGCRLVRVRSTAAWTGTATVTAVLTAGGIANYVLNLGALKAASTAALTTDAASVVALSPNSALPAGTNNIGNAFGGPISAILTNASFAMTGTGTIIGPTACGNYASFGITLTGVWTGTIVVQTTVDAGTTWQTIALWPSNGPANTYLNNITQNIASFAGNLNSATQVRLQATVAGTGSVTATMNLSGVTVPPTLMSITAIGNTAAVTAAAGVLKVGITGNANATLDAASGSAVPTNGLMVGGGSIAGGTNFTAVTVKAASVAAAATDTSLVVAVSPNNSVAITQTGAFTQFNGLVKLVDTGGTTQATVKAASTAVVATDTALVVGFSPNTGLPTGANTIGKVDILGNAGATLDAASGSAVPTNGLMIGGGSIAGGTNFTAATVKAASVAEVFTDTGLVVAVRPGGPLVTTSAALADAVANPTLGQVSNMNYTFNGSTWDRVRGMGVSTTTGDTGAKVATGNGATQTNVGNKGIQIVLNMGAVTGTSPTFVLKVQGSVDGGTNWFDVPGATTASLVATGLWGITIYPGIAVTAGTTTTGSTAGASGVLPRTWRVVWTIGGTTPSFTITSVTFEYIPN